MLYQSRTPIPPLDRFISRLWCCSDAPAHPRERILPNGTLEMVFSLREDEIRIGDPFSLAGVRSFSGAVVSGAYSQYFVVDPSVHASMVGIHFRPGGALGFLGVPVGELADRHVDLEALWGGVARQLRERLCEAVSPEARFHLLEEALLVRMVASIRHHPSVPFALRALEPAGEELRVRDVAQQLGLSQRRFIQVFTAAVGMSPKRYHRVRRFKRAKRLLGSDPHANGVTVALECGYFDQSHLIRDFQEFLGFSPTEFLQRRSERVLPGHLPLTG